MLLPVAVSERDVCIFPFPLTNVLSVVTCSQAVLADWSIALVPCFSEHDGRAWFLGSPLVEHLATMEKTQGRSGRGKEQMSKAL